MLGEHSLLDAEHLDPYVLGNLFTLGTHPPRVSGMKVGRGCHCFDMVMRLLVGRAGPCEPGRLCRRGM